MSERRTHEALVDRQFGPQAVAYLNSAVHAKGDDLDALAALVEDQGRSRVLDLGCGAGHVSFSVAPRVREVVAYDLSADMLEAVAGTASQRGLRNIATRQGPAESLPFADESFDYVLTRFSAHHWRDVELGLKEAARVLRRDGVLGVVDAVSTGSPLLDTWLQAIELLRDPSHVRDYSCAEWENASARAGLKVTQVSVSRLRLDFDVWVQRMRTPPVLREAIRALQLATSDQVSRYFEIDASGSFSIDVGLFRAVKLAR